MFFLLFNTTLVMFVVTHYSLKTQNNIDSFTQQSYQAKSVNLLQAPAPAVHELCENVNFNLLYSMTNKFSMETSRVYLRTVENRRVYIGAVFQFHPPI